MTVKQHAGLAVVALVAGALGAGGLHQVLPEKQRIVEKHSAVRVVGSKYAWPDLTQDETITIGEKLAAKLKGVNITIFCNDSTCDELAHDLDDAMQIAGLSSALERSVTPLDEGFSVVSREGDDRALTLAEAIKDGTGGRLIAGLRRQDLGADAIAIAIGKHRR